jgi:hypothetical protein
VGVKKGRKCDLATDLTYQRRYKSNKRKWSVAQATGKYLEFFLGFFGCDVMGKLTGQEGYEGSSCRLHAYICAGLTLGKGRRVEAQCECIPQGAAFYSAGMSVQMAGFHLSTLERFMVRSLRQVEN